MERDAIGSRTADLRLADRWRFHKLFAIRLQPSVFRATSASHKVRKVRSFTLRHETCKSTTANRSKCRPASGRLRNGDENITKYSRRRLRLTATLCQRSRERKPSDAIDPPPSRCRLVRSMRIRDVLRIPRTCHTNVMQPRNIIIGNAYAFVRCPAGFSWLSCEATRIIRIMALVHICEILVGQLKRVSPESVKRISPSNPLIHSS